MVIAKPTKEQVEKYLKRWDSLENYVSQERSLKKLFTKTYPKNNDLDEVLVKVCTLNDFYSTNIFSPFTVAKHILNLKIDKNLLKNDLCLVNKIAYIKMPKGRKINFYSFATKYCSHHLPTVYPIYDSYVEKLLMYFKKTDNFAKFKRADLKTYPIYRDILMKFREFYKLRNL